MKSFRSKTFLNMLQFYTNYDKVIDKKDRREMQDSILSDYLGNFKHLFCFHNTYVKREKKSRLIYALQQ